MTADIPGFHCSAPKKLDRLGLEFPVFRNLAGRRQKDEIIKVTGAHEFASDGSAIMALDGLV